MRSSKNVITILIVGLTSVLALTVFYQSYFRHELIERNNRLESIIE
ncbi:hypothetical protein ACFSJW_00345 [Flavobacterium artemisiae]|uniref:Two-component sensor histidine kinase n=1 Tax=Flavobacterium artemisiae TaxID=2126556 RepID=A0ABW4HHT8_9FLAO